MSNKSFASVAIVDAIAGLAGDTGAHCTSVAAIVGAALATLVQHGTNGPIIKAATYLHTLKGRKLAIVATREAFAAALSAVEFIKYSTESGEVTDTRDKKRGSAEDAARLADDAQEAFILAFGTRFASTDAPKKQSASDKAAKALSVLLALSDLELAQVIATADCADKMNAAAVKARVILAADKAKAAAAAAAPRRVKAAPATQPAAPEAAPSVMVQAFAEAQPLALAA